MNTKVIRSEDVKVPGYYWVGYASAANDLDLVDYDEWDIEYIITDIDVDDSAVYIGPLTQPGISIKEAIVSVAFPPEPTVSAPLAIPPLLQRAQLMAVPTPPVLTKVEQAGPPALVKVTKTLAPPLKVIHTTKS